MSYACFLLPKTWRVSVVSGDLAGPDSFRCFADWWVIYSFKMTDLCFMYAVCSLRHG